jgi:hypothetical protein
MVDRMLGHPFGYADLALDHAALKRDIALVAVGDDFFDTTAGASRQNMTENGNKRHEHQTSSFRQLLHAKLMPDAKLMPAADGRPSAAASIGDFAPEASAPYRRTTRLVVNGERRIPP